MPQVQSCDQGSSCQNSVENRGETGNKCLFCRLAPGNENLGRDHWKPTDGRTDHLVLKEEKINKSRVQKVERAQKRGSRDKGRKKVQKQAQRAEKSTERNIIEATKNSGRSSRDGDHIAGGFITLDTKHQSQREHPVVLLSELSKVQQDARNAGNSIGGLVLRNKHGVGVVVFNEQDFARVILGGDRGNGNT
jgi:hypothetical protein